MWHPLKTLRHRDTRVVRLPGSGRPRRGPGWGSPARVPRAWPPDDLTTARPFSLQIRLWVSLHPANPAMTVPRPHSVLAAEPEADAPASSAERSSGSGSSRSPRTATRDPRWGWSHRGSSLHWAPPPSGVPCRPRRVGSAGQPTRPLPCLSQNLTRSESAGRLARASTGQARSWARLRWVVGEAHRRTAGWGRSPSSGQTCQSRRTPPPPRGGGTRLSGHWCRCLGRGGGSQASGDSGALTPGGPVCPTCTQWAD